MLNDRQVAKIHRQIADAGDTVDAKSTLLDALVLTIFPEHLSAQMKSQIDQVANARRLDFEHAKAEWLSIATVVTKQERSAAQNRLDAAIDKLARNGVPYARTELNPTLQASLEAEYALQTQYIELHHMELNRRQLGQSGVDGISDRSDYQINLAIAGFRSRLRQIERRLGLPTSPGLFDSAQKADQ